MANGLAAALCRRPESTILSTRSESESGYYLVTTWLFHLFPSDVYRKNLRFANRKTNLRPISDYGAADLISPPPKPEIHLAEFAKSSTCLCIFNIFELNDLCRVPGKYIVETR